MNNSNTPRTGDNQTVGAKVKEAAGTASEQLKSQAEGVANTVASDAEGYANEAKGAAADEIKGVASALRTAADELRSGSPQERTFSQIADGLADASDAMRGKDLSEMVDSVNGFAKRNPLMFLGSAALIGFAATRFAKASNKDQHATQSGPTNSPTTGRYGTPTAGSPVVTPTGPATPAINTAPTGGQK
ncbi:hypothetical protein [Pseudooceanicola sp.]|mgnify:CR=1 FL=1|jgi:uncharacterized protein YjbJ (UPF0337 family)|uniref:hypothetical protein n=1 Tax=Pseudooceanicola sp. TaxID=1914328 RepID=UPI004057E5F7|tara:strand:+ start:2395 stop:2961 length:567 start_codon:yes stop_codon:yes gene_type:complete